MIEVALPIFAQDSLGRGALGFGIMMSGLGAGSVIGALLGPALLRQRRRGLIAFCLGIAEGRPAWSGGNLQVRSGLWG